MFMSMKRLPRLFGSRMHGEIRIFFVYGTRGALFLKLRLITTLSSGILLRDLGLKYILPKYVLTKTKHTLELH